MAQLLEASVRQPSRAVGLEKDLCHAGGHADCERYPVECQSQLLGAARVDVREGNDASRLRYVRPGVPTMNISVVPTMNIVRVPNWGQSHASVRGQA